jgi:hypothetical protein
MSTVKKNEKGEYVTNPLTGKPVLRSVKSRVYMKLLKNGDIVDPEIDDTYIPKGRPKKEGTETKAKYEYVVMESDAEMETQKDDMESDKEAHIEVDHKSSKLRARTLQKKKPVRKASVVSSDEDNEYVKKYIQKKMLKESLKRREQQLYSDTDTEAEDDFELEVSSESDES